jgi:hypothetical protein
LGEREAKENALALAVPRAGALGRGTLGAGRGKGKPKKDKGQTDPNSLGGKAAAGATEAPEKPVDKNAQG